MQTASDEHSSATIQKEKKRTESQPKNGAPKRRCNPSFENSDSRNKTTYGGSADQKPAHCGSSPARIKDSEQHGSEAEKEPKKSIHSGCQNNTCKTNRASHPV